MWGCTKVVMSPLRWGFPSWLFNNTVSKSIIFKEIMQASNDQEDSKGEDPDANDGNDRRLFSA